MHLKKILVVAALITTASCETTTSTEVPRSEQPKISIGCFKSAPPCRDQIAIVNNSKSRSATNLNIFCPDKQNPATQYQLASGVSLDPNSFKCVSKDEIRAHCGFSYGFFIGDNVAIKVTSDDAGNWEKRSTCTWD